MKFLKHLKAKAQEKETNAKHSEEQALKERRARLDLHKVDMVASLRESGFTVLSRFTYATSCSNGTLYAILNGSLYSVTIRESGGFDITKI